MTTARRLMPLMLVFAFVLAAAGCSSEPEEPALDPAIAPPLIAEAGVLRAGVDTTYPPFAGVDEGVEAGIDVDIAAAVAERLGLRLELVPLKPAEITEALTDGRVDIALGATAITDAALADVSTAGSYLIDGPALFSIVPSGTPEPAIDPAALGGMRVGVQKESPAYWTLESDYGTDFAVVYDTLRDALEALEAGEVDVVVGGAAVGAYIARDLTDVRIVGQMGPASPLGVVVRKDAAELEAEVRTVLDALAAEGVVDTITRKWLGDFPKLEVSAE